MKVSGFNLNLKKDAASSGLCGLQMTEKGAAISYVIWKDKVPELACCDFLPSASSPELFLPALSYFVKRNKLERVPCSWILHSQDYTLLSIGHLPVPSNEISQALRWHVKERIDFPLTEASMDYFTVSYSQFDQAAKKEDFIYAVIAKKNFLEKTAAMIKESGLDLRIIDIPELALRNIATMLLKDHQGSVGLIEVNGQRLSLLIIQKSFICFFRQIEWDKKNGNGVEKLTLEIQRSLDYYENQLGQSPVQHFYISPEYQFFYPDLPDLTISLPFQIKKLEWEILKDKRCFIAAGGALRCEEEKYVTTN